MPGGHWYHMRGDFVLWRAFGLYLLVGSRWLGPCGEVSDGWSSIGRATLLCGDNRGEAGVGIR